MISINFLCARLLIFKYIYTIQVVYRKYRMHKEIRVKNQKSENTKNPKLNQKIFLYTYVEMPPLLL